jgi:methionyl-tRNA formyltransferase
MTMNIQILTDDADSWFVPFGHRLKNELTNVGHHVNYIFDKSEMINGDICFLLSCSRLISRQYLQLHKHNIVVHASDLPCGKGFSPLQWQILEGKAGIKLTLFEAVEACDAGPYYFKEDLVFDGSELYDELRNKLACKIIDMCLSYANNMDRLNPISQTGLESVYPRRTSKNDELDVNQSIAKQFNHLRIADNERHPAYFMHRGCMYIVKIYKAPK